MKLRLFDDRYIGRNSLFGRYRAWKYRRNGWVLGQYWFKPQRKWWRFW